MSAIIAIPARLESTRLPNKMLLKKNGHPLIWHTILQAEKTGLPVVVATDSMKIFNLVDPFCIPIFTEACESGTERIVDALYQPSFIRYDYVVNWQGDEPEFPPERVLELLEEMDGYDIGTFCTKPTADELYDPNTVKVRVNGRMEAVRFTRETSIGYKHMGIYIFSKKFIQDYPFMEDSEASIEESLEQIKWMENGYKILVKNMPESTIGIDTEEDYRRYTREKI